MRDPPNPSGAIHVAGGHVPDDHAGRVANKFCACDATEFTVPNKSSDRCAGRRVFRQ